MTSQPSTRRMHPDELHSDEAMVARLVASQFPQWGGLPVQRYVSSGTVNAIYRLGDDVAARLPLLPGREATLDRVHRWLPLLAPNLPLRVPLPLAEGAPGEGFPERWCVHEWLPGEPTDPERDDLQYAARALAALVGALGDITLEGGPAPAPENYGRGAPLAVRDQATRDALAAAWGLLPEEDLATLTDAWTHAVSAPQWDGPPRWLHGDLMPANLVAQDGRLSGVLDFGALGVGDPACDLMVAWHLLDAPSREVFRVGVGLDDAAWARGRGWALSQAIIALPYYVETNAGMAAQARRSLRAVLEDWRSGGNEAAA